MPRKKRRYDGPPRQDSVIWEKVFSAGVSDMDFDRAVERHVRECLDSLREQLEADADFTDAQRSYALAKTEPLVRAEIRKQCEQARKRLLH